MRLFVKPFLLALLMALPWFAEAQIPAPQIGLTGNIGTQGFPLLNSGTLILSSDANHTMTAQETSAFSLKVTSSVSLTATRNLIMPAGTFSLGCIENATTGAHSIQIIGSTGTGVTVANSAVVCGIWNDGTNYVTAVSGSGTVNSASAFAPTYYPATGTAVSGATPFSGIQKDSASAPPSAAAAADVIGLWTGTCTGTNVLQANGTCGADAGLKPATGLWGEGDSYIVGTGATQPAVTGIFGLLARDTPAAIISNNAIGGAISQAISLQTTRTFLPNPTQSAVSITDGGANDGVEDTCGGVSPSACITNFENAMMAQEAWLTIPFQFRQLASNATQTGGWSPLGGNIIGVSPIYASNGTGLQVSASGATLTFAIPSSASPVVGVTYEQVTGQTGNFTVSIDGTLRTDNCSMTTTFSSGPCTAYSLADTGISRQEYVVTPGISHSVVITTTNASVIQILSADWVPPAGTSNENAAFVVGVNLSFANSVIYDTASKAIVTQLAGDGLPVFFVDLQHGTPGVNDTTDISNSATTTCPASTYPDHPNDCGYANMLATVQTTEIAANFIFSQLGSGGKAVYLNGKIAVPLQTVTIAGTLASGYQQFCTVGQVGGCGLTFFNDNASDMWGAGFTQDASTGQTWSGNFNSITSFGTTGFGCFYQYNGSGYTAGSNFTARWCEDYATGSTSQLGTMTAPSLVTQSASVLASSGSGNLVSFGNATGLLVDSGNSAANLAHLNTSNVWTAANGFNQTVEVTALPSTSISGNTNSPCWTIQGTYWNGSISASDAWCWSDSVGTGTNPTTSLTLTHAGASGGQAVTLPFPVFVSSLNASGTAAAATVLGSSAVAANTPTAATSGANSNSPPLQAIGSIWNGSIPVSDVWGWMDVVGAGTNPANTYTLSHSGSSGNSAVSIPSPVTAPDILPSTTPVTSSSLGSGITSVSCASGFTCNSKSGVLAVVATTFTTGTVGTVVWPATAYAQGCLVSQAGGTTWFGWNATQATTTGFTLSVSNTITTSTQFVQYQCVPIQ